MTQPPLDEIKRRIVEALRPRRILLYGSRARGDARPDSDLDLIVEMDTTLSPAERILQVLRLFPNRAWAMDVQVFTPEEARRLEAVHGTLLSLIQPEAQVLYEAT